MIGSKLINDCIISSRSLPENALDIGSRSISTSAGELIATLSDASIAVIVLSLNNSPHVMLINSLMIEMNSSSASFFSDK